MLDFNLVSSEITIFGSKLYFHIIEKVVIRIDAIYECSRNQQPKIVKRSKKNHKRAYGEPNTITETI